MAPGSGFLLIYIDNQSIGKDVWFDNLLVTQYSSDVLEEDHYYPFGLTLNINAAQMEAQKNPYKLTTKELESKFDLNMYDFGARTFDMTGPRWGQIDELAEKYYSISPYAYCANNPVNYVDLDGRKIDPASQAEWNQQKQNVTNKRDETQVIITATNIANAFLPVGSQSSTTELTATLTSLNSTLNNLTSLEGSTQVYGVQNIGNTANGGTTYDPQTGNINFAYGTTANFIHETTHGGQYESGEIGFNVNTGGIVGQDLQDEVAAYKAQAAYDITSVSKLGSSSVANSVNAITTTWVQNLVDNTGSKPYSIGGSANTGLIPINKNSTKTDLINAYPNATGLQSLPANFILNSVPNYKFKP